jgi:flagellar FliJ protein
MFKFSLQRVLELRAKREREMAGQLARARTAADEARDRCDAIEAARDAGRERMSSPAPEARSVGEMQHLSFVLEQLDQHVQTADAVARKAEDTAVRVRHDLTAALVERRILDRLRDRLLDEYRSGEVRQDRTTMDDIAASRFVQRTRPTGRKI